MIAARCQKQKNDDEKNTKSQGLKDRFPPYPEGSTLW